MDSGINSGADKSMNNEMNYLVIDPINIEPIENTSINTNGLDEINNEHELLENALQKFGEITDGKIEENIYDNGELVKLDEQTEKNEGGAEEKVVEEGGETKTTKTKKSKDKDPNKTPKQRKNGLVEGVDFVWRTSKSGTKYKYKYQLSKTKKQPNENTPTPTKAGGKKKLLEKYNSENDGANQEGTTPVTKKTTTKKTPKKRKQEEEEQEDDEFQDENAEQQQQPENGEENALNTSNDSNTPPKKRKNGLVEGVDFVWRTSKSGTTYKYKYKPTKTKTTKKDKKKNNKSESTASDEEVHNLRIASTTEDILDTVLFPKWLPNVNSVEYIQEKDYQLYGPKEHSLKLRIGKKADVQSITFGNTMVSKNNDKMDEAFINCGGMIKDVCWAPISEDDDPDHQYIAVAANKDIDTRYHTLRPSEHKGIIQIYELNLSKEGESIASRIYLCHEFGGVHELKFCPQSSSSLPEEFLKHEAGEGVANRMGLLGAVFTDGTVRVFSVPFPRDLKKDSIFIKLEPVLTFRIQQNFNEQALALCLNWTGDPHKQPCILLVGCTKGSLASFNLSDIYKTNYTTPLFHIVKDSNPILTVAFNPFNHNEFIYGNCHGFLLFGDLRTPEAQKDSYYPGNEWMLSAVWTDYSGTPTIAMVSGKDILRFTSKPRDGRFVLSTKQVSTQTLWQISILPGTLLASVASYDGSAILYILDSPKSKQKVVGEKHYVFNKITLEKDKEDFSRQKDIYCVNTTVLEKDSISPGEAKIGPEDVSVNCVSMNPNEGFHGWVASGASNGLLRLQNLRNKVPRFDDFLI